MKRRFIQTGLATIFGIGLLALSLGWMAHNARAMQAALKEQQVNENGFGDYLNKQIPSLAIFDDYLYAGTWHWISETASAQIWRSVDGLNWEMVDERPVDGAGAMISFDSSIYAGSWDGNIWASPNGITWTEVITDGFNGSDQGIAHFAIYEDTLYASTWYTGTQIWRTDNGSDWELFIDHGLGDLNNYGAPSSEVFNGYLYWGVGNGATGAQLWRTDGITMTAVITDGFGSPENEAVSSLAFFKDMLYAGITSFPNGAQVFRSTNGSDWQPVSGGFTYTETNSINSLEVYLGKLYLMVQNDLTGLEVWRTDNGSQWEQVGFNGFGDPANTMTYWDNATLVFKDKLYTGVMNWPTGVEVWQLSELKNTYMPLLFKNYANIETGKIVFSSARDGMGEIYTMKYNGSAATRLTFNNVDDLSPDWSPDGSRIAYSSKLSGEWEIYVMDADGSNQIQLTTMTNCFVPQWSPDGTRIAFYTRQSNNNIIYTMDPDGNNLFQVTEPVVSAYDPYWSPDGTKIAFQSTRTIPGIYIIDPDGTDQELLLEASDVVYFAWSPDGSKLALTKTVLPSYTVDLFIYDIASGLTTRVTDTALNHNSVDWSPEGRYLIFHSNLDEFSNFDVYSITLDGKKITRLTDNPAGDSEADWVK